MLLEVFTRLIILCSSQHQKGNPSTFISKRRRFLLHFLYYSLNTILLLAIARGCIISLLAFASTKEVSLPLPSFIKLDAISFGHLYRQYRLADPLVDILLRTGVNPIMVPLLGVGVLFFLLYINVNLFHLKDAKAFLILRELETLHQQVKVIGREPFKSINWKQLNENPKAFLYSKVDYLYCLLTGKDCLIRRQLTDPPLCIFPYLKVRNQSVMILLTYFFESELFLLIFLVAPCK